MNHTIRENCLNFWEFEKKLSSHEEILHIRNVVVSMQDYILLDTAFFRLLNSLLKDLRLLSGPKPHLTALLNLLAGLVGRNRAKEADKVRARLEEVDQSTLNEWVFHDQKVRYDFFNFLNKKPKSNSSNRVLKVD